MTAPRRSAFTVKNVETTSGGWTAVASTASVDRDGEIVERYAFNPLPSTVPVHMDHTFKAADVVGKATPYYDNLGVLHVDGTFAQTKAAQDVRRLIQDGFINSMSVAFLTKERSVQRDGTPVVEKAELLAVDFVSVPANADARVLEVRGLKQHRQPRTLLTVRPHISDEEQHAKALWLVMQHQMEFLGMFKGEQQ